jgi:hypothetical protein
VSAVAALLGVARALEPRRMALSELGAPSATRSLLAACEAALADPRSPLPPPSRDVLQLAEDPRTPAGIAASLAVSLWSLLTEALHVADPEGDGSEQEVEAERERRIASWREVVVPGIEARAVGLIVATTKALVSLGS